MRMVPRENEAINETWIADRDRFGFEGMYSADRVSQPHDARRRRSAGRRLGSGVDRRRGGLAEDAPPALAARLPAS